VSYQLLNILKDGSGYDITPLAGSIKWSGDIRQAARKLEVSRAFGKDFYLPKYDVPLGSILILNGAAGEIIRAVAFSVEKDTDGGYQVAGYDHLVFMVKSTGTYKFKGIPADDIIRKLCGDFNITVGDIPSTGIPISVIMREQTIYDMCLIALTETSKRNGKKYQLRMRAGRLQVVEKGQQTVRWLITEGQNLSRVSYSESIEDMKNRIVITGDNDQVLATVDDTALISQYGLLQEMKKENKISTGEAQQMASNLLKDLGKVMRESTITCLGLDDVEAGVAAEVKESLTGLTGIYYVENDSHTVENGQHTMTLKLAWTDEVATKEASDEQ
jgi:hypothetical protein